MLLKTLTELNGTSGYEKKVREYIKTIIEPYVDSIKVDSMGNLYAFKGLQSEGPKVLLAAHMDEVGLMITEITNDGFLKFEPVGGIDPRILVSKSVSIGESLIGVIGTKAIHLQKKSERDNAIQLNQLYIDIGATSKDEASKYVKIGEYAHFISNFSPLGDNFLTGKAMDDRVGCAIIIEVLKKDYNFPVVAAFTVQEEVGLRGSKVAAFEVDPDFAIVVEGTVASDILEADPEHWITELGKGPAISIMDRTTLFSPKLVKYVAGIATEQAIPYQFRRGGTGGNDAGRIHISKSGVPTLAISVPCRYIHSMTSIISENDYLNTTKLVTKILESLPESLSMLRTDLEE